MSRLLIVGCGGHGRVVADTAIECGYTEIAFLDDNTSVQPPFGAQLLGSVSLLEGFSVEWPSAIAAMGNGKLRLELFTRLRGLEFRTPSIVHPSAIVSRSAAVQDGVFIAAGAIVNTGARIGEAVIINTGARVDHDCDVGPGSHIAPGATLSGGVTVGARAWLGTGCAIRQGITIGNDVMVGVGAAVVTDLIAAETYVGVPARLLQRKSSKD